MWRRSAPDFHHQFPPFLNNPIAFGRERQAQMHFIVPVAFGGTVKRLRCAARWRNSSRALYRAAAKSCKRSLPTTSSVNSGTRFTATVNFLEHFVARRANARTVAVDTTGSTRLTMTPSTLSPCSEK